MKLLTSKEVGYNEDVAGEFGYRWLCAGEMYTPEAEHTPAYYADGKITWITGITYYYPVKLASWYPCRIRLKWWEPQA